MTPSYDLAHDPSQITELGYELKIRLKSVWPWLVLAVWPLVLALTNSKWLYNGFWYDPFVYLGGYLRLPEQLRAWGDLYWYSRLGFLLPGYVAYHVLPPLIANACLHLSRYYIAIFTLFSLLRRHVGVRGAFFAALLMGGYSHFLIAVGRDYPDGASVVYLLLAMWAVSRTFAALRPWAWLLAAGVALGAGLHTHFFTVTLWPAAGLYLLLAQPSGWTRRRLIEAGFWVLAGIAAITAMLGAVSWAMGGNFLFFLSTLRFLQDGAFHSGTVYLPPSVTDILPYAAWLMTPAVVAVAAAGSLINRLRQWRVWRNSPDKVFSLSYFVAITTLLAVGVRGSTTILNREYYVVYIMPFMALALGGLLAGALGRLSRVQWLALLGLLTLAVPAAIRISATMNVGSAGWIVQYGGWITLGGLLAVLIILLLRRCDFLGLVALTAIFALINPIGPSAPDTLATDDSQARKTGFEIAVRSIDVIGSRWNKLTWLMFNEQLNPIDALVACAISVCHQNIVSRDYPELRIQYSRLSAVQELQPGRQLILLASQPEDLSQAIRATGEAVTAPVLDMLQIVRADNTMSYLSFYHMPVTNWAIDLLPGRSMGYQPNVAQAIETDGSIASLPDAKAAGPLAYGGQFDLPAGHYVALFTISASDNASGAEAALLEIVGQDGALSLDEKLAVRGTDFGALGNPVTFKLMFAIGPNGGSVAPLVYSDNLMPLRFQRFQLKRVSD